MTKFKFGDKVNCIHGVGIVTRTYFDYEFDEFICEVVFILDGKTCTYKSLEGELTKVSDWIPCSERMPEDDKSVLVINDKKIITQASLFEGNFYPDAMDFCIDYDDRLKATHWMLIPEIPEVK